MKNRKSIKKKLNMSKYLLLPAAVILVLGLAGCSVRTVVPETEEKGITITIFDKNAMNDTFDDRVAQEIMKRTGIKIELADPTENPEEKLNLMLAYKDYPDIMLMNLKGGDMINKYISSEVFIDLAPYIEQYGNHISSMYAETLPKLQNQEGKIYYLSNWYGEDPDAVTGFLMRYDILKELVGEERADSSQPYTMDEFLGLMNAFKEKYPRIDGRETVPMTVNPETDGYIDAMFGMFGMKKYYEAKEGIRHQVYDPHYLDMILFFNRLYREGCLDKEWLVNKSKRSQEKLESGLVFSSLGSYWDVTYVNANLRQKFGKDAAFYCYKVIGNGVQADETTYSGRNSLGWDAIGITKNCKNVEAAMKLIDFLASEEGQYLMLWGVEGQDWDMVEGKHVPRQEVLDQFQEDYNGAMNRTGIRKWTWFIKNGAGVDGTPYDLTTKYLVSDEAKIANQNIGLSDYWDTAVYDGLEPAVGSAAALKQQNIQDIYKRTFPRMIYASTEAEAVSIYEKLIQDMESEGLAEVESVINQNYRSRMQLWQKQMEWSVE